MPLRATARAGVAGALPCDRAKGPTEKKPAAKMEGALNACTAMLLKKDAFSGVFEECIAEKDAFSEIWGLLC